MIKMTLEEFHAAIKSQSTATPAEVTFRCPLCGTLQSANDLIKAGAGADFQAVEKYLAFSCVGRWDDTKGCDWTLGGLFQLHELVVIADDGKEYPRFLPTTEPGPDKRVPEEPRKPPKPPKDHDRPLARYIVAIWPWCDDTEIVEARSRDGARYQIWKKVYDIVPPGIRYIDVRATLWPRMPRNPRHYVQTEMFDNAPPASSSGDARCNFCDGPMPCSCTPPPDAELDELHRKDAEARNRVDQPRD